jgi:hypothetical protein
MQGLSMIQLFQGYEDLVRNFWGLDKWDVTLDEDKIGEWLRATVIMLDEIPEGNPLQEIGFENEEEAEITIGSKQFKVFMLTGDGGFRSMLVKREDYWPIMKEDDTLLFVGVPGIKM